MKMCKDSLIKLWATRLDPFTLARLGQSIGLYVPLSKVSMEKYSRMRLKKKD